MSDLKWGSAEWETHLRRSLAQKKRHGAKIDDINGLIEYIKEKGPAKKSTRGQNNKTQVRGSNVVGAHVNFRSRRQRLR